MARTLYTSNHVAFTVSDEDYIFVVGFGWNYSGDYIKCNNSPYNGITLHRIIIQRMRLDRTNDIDHIDGNRLNNQRGNLRLATRSQNAANSKVPSNNTSGSKGVAWNEATHSWRAHIKVHEKLIYLGLFDTVKAAAFAYKIAAKRYFGEFANTGAK